MKKIHVLVFSKDRALQLEATLRSFLIHAEQNKIGSLSVLYKTSSSRFLTQYKRLIKDYPQVRFIRETDFRKDLIKIFSETLDRPFARFGYILYATINGFQGLLRRSMAELIIKTLLKLGIKLGRLPLYSCCASQYWLLTVDDNLFIRPVNIGEIINALERHSTAIGFSLRLGENVKYCYMSGTLQKTPEFVFDQWNANVLFFEWENAEYDFGYPLEISGTVYRSSLLIPLVASLYFTTPNMLESKMSSLKKWYAKRYPRLICYSSSVSFCNPLNKVQTDRSKNRSGSAFDYSIESLANLFDEGKRIDVVALSQFIPNACHQEVELSYIDT